MLIIRSLYGHVLGFNMDFFYAPLFIFFLLIFVNQVHNGIVSKVFTTLGEASVYMWFFHALFFTTVVRGVYQPFIAISDSLWITTLWTIIVTFGGSWCIKSFVHWLSERFSIKFLK